MGKVATMTVWNVQLGLAVHVKSPNNKYIIIDLGTGTRESGNGSPLSKRIRDNIAYMILTHPHLDHIDDILCFDYNAPKVLQRVDALTNREVMSGVRVCDKTKFEKYCDINDRYNKPISLDDENSPSNPDNYGGLGILTFSTTKCDHSNFNNFSIITVFTLSRIKIVVCGDNEKESFNYLMQQDDFKDAIKNADVLIAPHHGRESGFHSEFVNTVNPRLTIISDTNKIAASASDKYTQKSRGWTVYNSNGSSQERKCLTTRNDRNIRIEFGENDYPNHSRFLHVELI